MAICPECEFEIDVDEYDVDRATPSIATTAG